MKITINTTRKKLAATFIFAALAVAAHIFGGISLFNMIVLPLLFLAVNHTEVEIKTRYQWLISIAAIVCAGAFTTALVQYLLLVEDLRDRISGKVFALNMVCVLVVYLFVQTAVNHLGAACITAHLLLFLFAFVNYFVYAFRGNELIFADIGTVFTGLSVASNYRFSLNAQAVNAILITIVFLAGALKLNIRWDRPARMRVVCISLIALLSLGAAREAEDRTTETWEQKGSSRNGFLLNFALSVRDSFVKKPESYSTELIESIEQNYSKEEAENAETYPTVIAIMNESFADLSVFGDLRTNKPVLPFLDSLTENTIKGYAISPVYGSKTPNSEWEFLTGNSTAFLPDGSVAYEQYVKEENAYSIVDALKEENYTCVAMHPYYETGWKRNAVYPKLGFDETYFLEDFDQSNPMRKYVSDETMYEKLIDRFEAKKEDERLFLFGVTMQNHGGYKDTYDGFETDVYGTNVHYADADQFLSLVHQSDEAIGKLVEYFSNADEPVVICFFGDHQPSLDSTFYYWLNGKGQSGLTLAELEEFFEVPFFIWTNYDGKKEETPYGKKEETPYGHTSMPYGKKEETVERVSLNFLSTLLLERAGIPLPPYQRFLADLKEAVPAMNPRGYYSNSLNRYVHYGEGSRKDEVWIERYRNLQYNGLFDDKNRSRVFFKRYEPAAP